MRRHWFGAIVAAILVGVVAYANPAAAEAVPSNIASQLRAASEEDETTEVDDPFPPMPATDDDPFFFAGRVPDEDNDDMAFDEDPLLTGYARRILPCCQQCMGGDVMCLSRCDRTCVPAAECNAAGVGAYTAFCRKVCRPLMALRAPPPELYFPKRACRGECAAQVQELCFRNFCQEFGCAIRNCAKRAPRTCTP